jgi:protein-S-isoprenylcysteine O-methyltransferase Ste14
MIRPQLAAWALWILFLVSWYAAMLWTAKAVTRERRGRRSLYFLAYTLGFVLLFAVPEWFRHGDPAAWRPPAATLPLWVESAAAGWALVAAELAAFAFAWWARIHLGRLWSGMITIREGHRVVDTGPYRLVRHPIYTGFIAACWALALVKASPASLVGAAILTLVMAWKAKDEEGFLRRELGPEAYDAYSRRTPMLVPFAPAPNSSSRRTPGCGFTFEVQRLV